MNKVLPQTSIRQLLTEYELNINVSEYVVQSFQTKLLPRAIIACLKPLIVSMIVGKRKRAIERDFLIMERRIIFPLASAPKDAELLMYPNKFRNLTNKCIRFLILYMNENIYSNAYEITIQVKHFETFQDYVESCIRGFVKKMKTYADDDTITIQDFDHTMGRILQDRTYGTNQDIVKFLEEKQKSPTKEDINSDSESNPEKNDTNSDHSTCDSG